MKLIDVSLICIVVGIIVLIGACYYLWQKQTKLNREILALQYKLNIVSGQNIGHGQGQGQCGLGIGPFANEQPYANPALPPSSSSSQPPPSQLQIPTLGGGLNLSLPPFLNNVLGGLGGVLGGASSSGNGSEEDESEEEEGSVVSSSSSSSVSSTEHVRQQKAQQPVVQPSSSPAEPEQEQGDHMDFNLDNLEVIPITFENIELQSPSDDVIEQQQPPNQESLLPSVSNLNVEEEEEAGGIMHDIDVTKLDDMIENIIARSVCKSNYEPTEDILKEYLNMKNNQNLNL